MTDPIAARLTLAETLSREGGVLALGYFSNRDSLMIDQKANPQDVASQADRETEALIRHGIAAAFPSDGILGEEDGLTEGTSGFTWVIDPIDGTSPFLAGLRSWCVAIALLKDDVTVAGVIHAPMAGETFVARRGGGVTLNGAPVAVGRDMTLDNSLVAIGASHRTSPRHVGAVIAGLMQAGGVFYRDGSGALMLASVAAGRLGGYYEPHMNSWDCLAGLLMIEEAGGLVAGYPALLPGGVVLGAAPGVHAALSAVVAAAQV